MLSDHTKAIIKSTAPVLQKHGKEITARMYQIAFTERPEYKRFFENTWMKHPLDGGPQPARLAEARASGLPVLHKPISGLRLRAAISSLTAGRARSP